MDNEELKSVVKEKYGEIARKSLSELKESTCCGTQCCSSTQEYTHFSDDYTGLKGYNAEADLKLGCGVPTEIAAIHPGDTVLDLGAGAGNDAFVARALVGESGRVIGLDMTEPMIEKARKNSTALGYTNVEFRLGDIENMPVEDSSVNVVISNCVLNLVPDKARAFSEMYRVMTPGGHFSVSDIVITHPLPSSLKKAALMYVGCVAGAIMKHEYLSTIEGAGFKNVQIKIEKPIILPTEVLSSFMSSDEISDFRKKDTAIQSITVYGEKQAR